MFNHKKTDIVVLGAGPVGLIAAHALASRNIDYVLLDRQQRTNIHSYALALHPDTLELLDSFGLAERILENSLQLSTVSIYEENLPKTKLDYTRLPLKYPFLTVISQGELEKILADTLKKKSHKPLWNHRVRFIEEQGNALNISVDRLSEGMTGYAVAHIETQIDKILDYQANYLIGADGHESVARRIAGIDFPEVSPSADYAVFEFKTDADLPNEMRLIIKDNKTHVYWPLPNGHCRWSFQVDHGVASNHSREKDHKFKPINNSGSPLLDHQHLNTFLADNAPWFTGSVEDLSWRILVNFEHHLANSFGKDRIWLAGDSAHTTPHAGILSMNVGMREAVELVDILSTTDTHLERQKALADYNEQRLVDWQRLLDLDHHIYAVDQTARWALGHRNNLIGNIPASGETLSELLAQLHLIDAA
ncbi:MAG: NAD(P)/FAD-dependent oxidoreductase [Opitutae bacterium]|nr:NAD(P)/FAD-dependent oxidoreductase [Opitutae bacterium]MDG1300019.1 NAD(P)/FAD-dependent oxidoreductase [Opitutae bacterium]